LIALATIPVLHHAST